jgi:glycine dehydrogenase subunit 1
MRYLPHTPEDVAAMLETMGARDLEDLFSAIPADCRRSRPMNLPEPLTEWELADHLGRLAADIGAPGARLKSYLGAGSYEHFIPQVVTNLAARSEFLTSYTPYQPEVSQGTLQAIYEFQTLICRLLGMEVANASVYDGASALAEAVLMAVRVTRRRKIALSRLVHPLYRRVVRTYLGPSDVELIELPYQEDGRTDLRALEGIEDLAAVAVQSPNFFGCIEELEAASALAHDRQALLVACFTEPIAFGLLRSPGSQGADIACGEGQSLGIPQSFGGPGLGLFATRMKYVRAMPGRLVGRAEDSQGRRGFVLTLATREQHIRREKATSNICTNHNLCALAASVYLATVGGPGLRELARLNRDKAEYLKRALEARGFRVPFPAPTFNEFVVEAPEGFEGTYERLVAKGIVPGLKLGSWYPELSRHLLVCVTETKSKPDLDELAEEMGR